ncbi:hypothetical protein M413DRAFT_449538 [Hebeloma cylindrosporum]|uniref:Uncharacterized protein n=1 Tax=Hebeloma cylindrosporum TaxID=76867 RepID=A0A0C2XDD4_HEBCY|nr:hypothetical protein M413DRAFT_449538 [Hebeloma cylindrosporum h7]
MIPDSGRDELVVGGSQELSRTHRGASQPGGRHYDEDRNMSLVTACQKGKRW